MSASQEWSDAIKAGMGIHDDLGPLTGEFHHDLQADFLPTSTLSPQRSPQASPDSQLHLQNVASVSQQEQDVSQSYTVSTYSEHIGEPQHVQGTAMQPKRNSSNMKQSGGNSNSNFSNSSNVGPGQGFTNRPQQFAPRGPTINMDQNSGHFAQPQNRMIRPPHPQDGYQNRPPLRPPQQNVHQRPQFHGSGGPRQPQLRMSGQSPQKVNPGGQYQHQEQISPGVRQQQPRNPNPSYTPLLSPNKCNTQNARPSMGAAPGQTRPFQPGHPQNLPRPGGALQQGARHPNPNNGQQFMPQRNPVPQGFQGMHYQRQSMGGPIPPEYNEDMFEDEDYDEDYDDDEEDMEGMEEEEQEMYRNNFSQNVNYGYPDSDSDEISDEEAALFEELSCCEDENRYEEIMELLREKGVDPEELDEIMYKKNLTNYQQGMFNEEDYDDEDEEGEEEEEGYVSSSSQRHFGPQQELQHLGHLNQRLHQHPQHGTNQTGGQASTGQGNQNVNKPGHSQMYQAHQPGPNPNQMTMSQQGLGPQNHSIRQLGQPRLKQPAMTSNNLGGQSQQQSWQPMKVNPSQGEVRLQGPKNIPLVPGQPSLQPQKPPIQPQSQPPASALHGDKICSAATTTTATNPIGAVVKPVQHLATPSGTQPLTPGQATQSKPNNQPGPMGQQAVLNPVTPAQQGPPASSPGPPQMVRATLPKLPAQPQPLSCGQQEVGGGLKLPQSLNRPQNPAQAGTNFLRGQSTKEVKKADLARLEVQHMQQVLDEEIKAKKGQSRLQLPNQAPPQRPPPPQQQQQQPVQPTYQPKHQLPPRQPIPAICDPNSGTVLAPGGRPVCSVVPFTSQSPAQVIAGSTPRPPMQQGVRPRIPGPISVQTNNLSLPNQMGYAAGTQNQTSPLMTSTVRAQGTGQCSPQSMYLDQPKTQDQTQQYQQLQQPQAYQPSPLPPLQGQQPVHSSSLQQSPASLPLAQFSPALQPAQHSPLLQPAAQPSPALTPAAAQQTPAVQPTQPISALHQHLPTSGLHQNPQTPGLHQNQQSSGLHQIQQSSGLHQIQQSLGIHQNQQSSGLHQNQQPSGLHQNQQLPAIQPSTQTHRSSGEFSLESLSEDKCIVKASKGNNKLTKGVVYQIRSPIDQSLVFAVWNGEKFEDLRDEELKAMQSKSASSGKPAMAQKQQTPDGLTQKPLGGQSSASDRLKSKICPGPANFGKDKSQFQAEFLLSLNKTSRDEGWNNTGSSSSSLESQRQEQGYPEQFQQKSELELPNNQSTYVKPLSAGSKKKEDAEEEDDESIFKKPFPEHEEYYRVCKNCGMLSKNFRRCDGCHKIFHGEVKVHTLPKITNKNAASSNKPGSTPASPVQPVASVSPVMEDPFGQIMNDVSFYKKTPSAKGSRGRGGKGAKGTGRTKGGGLKGRGGARQGDNSSDTDESVSGRKSSDGSSGSQENPAKKRPARQKTKNATPKKRAKKHDEPVTLTISSDEDEPSSTSNSLPNQAPSPARSTGGDSPIFPSLPSEPVNAFGRFRRVRMEDEDGISKLSKKIHMRTMEPMMDRLEDEDEEDEDEDEDEVPIYEIDIRSVRIGSMRTQPEGPLMINMRGVCFKVRSERTDEPFECEILAQEVELVKYFSGQIQPVLFLLLTQECGEKLREIFHMEPGDDEYFDPSSTDMKQKMVVIIIECFNYMPEAMLKETLSLWADMNQMDDEDFIEELTEEGANDLLIQSAPPVLTANVDKNVLKFKRRYMNDCNDTMLSRQPVSPSDSTDNEPDSTSSSPPEAKEFVGPQLVSHRLLQYPPPPLRGIPITTEDLYCLTEGEFLNDVIIDFYLQYLYLERLSPENKQRTHIFSSFFYKRLTQRDRHVEKSEDDAKKSLPERRHARVKKWTKTVDLFTKDFIIVPINEHSHWYLAVICFPGLAAQEPVCYVPNTCHLGEEDTPETGGPEEEANTSTSNSQDPTLRTILGRHLEPGSTGTSDVICEGIKQPCILMFDSLAGPSRAPNVKMLREYLQCEWNAKKANQEPRNISKILRGSTPRVPQQSNYSDCGVYLLQYVQSFFEDPIGDFQIPMKGLQSWFPEDLVLNKRRYIHELIISLHRRYQAERGDPRIFDIKYDTTPREPPIRIPPPRSEENMQVNSREDECSNSSMSGDASNDQNATLPSQHPLDNFLLDKGGDHGEIGVGAQENQPATNDGCDLQKNSSGQTEMSVNEESKIFS